MSENYNEETGEVYDLDEYVSFANTPLKDDKGYIKAKLVKIDRKLLISSKKRTSRDLADDVTQKAFKFIFEVKIISSFLSIFLKDLLLVPEIILSY